jgi:hypothetical protein
MAGSTQAIAEKAQPNLSRVTPQGLSLARVELKSHRVLQ